MESIEFMGGGEEMKIDVDFDFLDPRPEFNISTRAFLHSLFDESCPIIDLADVISQQVEIGTYLVADNGDQPESAVMGFITLLDLENQTPSVSYIRSYISSKLELPENSCLLLCERIINSPAELIAPLYNQLAQDLAWARENSQLRHEFTTVFVITRCVKALPGDSPSKKRTHENFLFFKPEDDVFFKYAHTNAPFEAEAGRMVHTGVGVQQPVNTEDDSCTHKMVLALKWNEFMSAMQEIQKTFSQ